MGPVSGTAVSVAAQQDPQRIQVLPSLEKSAQHSCPSWGFFRLVHYTKGPHVASMAESGETLVLSISLAQVVVGIDLLGQRGLVIHNKILRLFMEILGFFSIKEQKQTSGPPLSSNQLGLTIQRAGTLTFLFQFSSLTSCF